MLADRKWKKKGIFKIAPTFGGTIVTLLRNMSL